MGRRPGRTWPVCLKKKKTAWVGGDYSIFMLILVSSLSLPKAASKLVSALLFAAFREQRGVWAGALRKSRLGLLSFFCRAGRSWTELDRAGPVSVLFKSKRIQHEERPEAAKGNGS